ncbi:hypothetical protein NUW58_g9977 [Xylaria curta]|uniref:Uncharacterized protein n=1 Tax=Xylaria curta TaxID=42375 RepID=A0ACC1MS08_9PEZI|nr:hypothetical protein NUW58_g9977 [Xylaria curta]
MGLRGPTVSRARGVSIAQHFPVLPSTSLQGKYGGLREGAVIGDLFPVIGRGKALSVWSIGPIVGPTLGPLIGAFIVGSIGWRWDPWIVFVPSTLVAIALAFYLPETCHKVLIDRKVKRLSRELDRDDLVNCYDAPGKRRVSQMRLLLLGLTRPLKMLVLAPIILLMSINVAFNYGTMYLMFNTIPPTFEDQYGFPTSLTGLIYLSLGLGYIIGLWSFSILSDRTVVRLTEKNNGIFEPEMRLHLVAYYVSLRASNLNPDLDLSYQTFPIFISTT